MAYISKFTGQGQLLWSRPTQPRAGMVHNSIQALNEMGNGDIWVLGGGYQATQGPNSEGVAFVQRLGIQTGDSIYTEYFLGTLGSNLRYLHGSPEGDRVFGIRPNQEEGAPFLLEEYDERGNFVRENGLEIFTWFPPHLEFVSTAAGDLFLNTGYVKGSSPLEYPIFHKIIDRSGITIQGLKDHALLSAIPNGEILTEGIVDGVGGFYIFADTPDPLAFIPESFFSLASGETRNAPTPQSPKMLFGGDILVSGSYPSGPSTRSLFLLRLDRVGNQVWKHYYPEMEGAQLKAQEVTPDGSVVLLLQRGDEVRLVKTDPQGVILSSTKDSGHASAEASLYPNPSSDGKAVMTFAKAFSGRIQIYDQVGKLCYESSFRNTSEIKIGTLLPLRHGVYLIKVSNTENYLKTYRLLIN